VRAYNIIGRADRYKPSEKIVDLPNVKGLPSIPKVPETPASKESLHEQVMHLMAVSRAVIWLPLPLLVIITKFTESLNVVNIFVFTKMEHLEFRRPFPLRAFVWFFSFCQMPMVLSIVFTASEVMIAVLSGSLVRILILFSLFLFFFFFFSFSLSLSLVDFDWDLQIPVTLAKVIPEITFHFSQIHQMWKEI
jgi:hypothetical protein